MALLSLVWGKTFTAFVTLDSLLLEEDQVAKPSETALNPYSSGLSICY